MTTKGENEASKDKDINLIQDSVEIIRLCSNYPISTNSKYKVREMTTTTNLGLVLDYSNTRYLFSSSVVRKPFKMTSNANTVSLSSFKRVPSASQFGPESPLISVSDVAHPLVTLRCSSPSCKIITTIPGLSPIILYIKTWGQAGP